MDNNDIGSKIKYFRKRAGLSQLELEIETDSAAGSISRIEAGKVNPTKGTLLKIIGKLNLTSTESASLFDLDMDELPRLVDASRKLHSTHDIDKILQSSVNEFAHDLNMHGVSIFLVRGKNLVAQTFTNSWYTTLAVKIFPKPFTKLSLSLTNNNNYFVRCVNEKKPQYSSDFRKFSIGLMPSTVSKILEKVTQTKSIIVLPLIQDSKSIGTVLFAKNYVDNFRNEIKILEVFTQHLSLSISNAQKYEELKRIIMELKNGQQ